MNAPTIPGLVFTGYTAHPLINGGQPVPLYELTQTDEDWIKSAAENSVHNYRKILGTEPPSVAAAVQWQQELVNQDLPGKGRS